MPDQLEPIITADGSSSLSSKNFNATYHSIHGAMEESMHVFISAGLYNHIRKGFKQIQVLEMGFGTGLNALLAAIAAQKHGIKLHYDTLELHPIPIHLVDQLKFETPSFPANIQSLKDLHTLSWNVEHTLNQHFTIRKIKEDIRLFESSKSYDIIFYDAFAPSSQPYLWEHNLHQKLYEQLNENGTLVTYCAQGKFKRMLKSLGYTLEGLNGPGRKHEMTRATKIPKI